MPLGKYIGIAAVGKSVLDTMLYQRFLARVAVLMMLSMITAILVGMLAGGLFYAAHFLLVRHGLEADIAFLTVGMGIAAAAAIFGALTVGYIRKFRHALQPLSPLASGVSGVATAFVDGLLAPPARKDVL